MDIYKNPPHRGHMHDASTSSHQKNPMCGDEITLQLKLADGKIADAQFEGTACAVSVIAASMLSDKLIGLPVKEAANLTQEDFLKSLDLNLTTSRVKCATLALAALKEALEDFADKKTEN